VLGRNKVDGHEADASANDEIAPLPDSVVDTDHERESGDSAIRQRSPASEELRSCGSTGPPSLTRLSGGCRANSSARAGLNLSRGLELHPFARRRYPDAFLGAKDLGASPGDTPDRARCLLNNARRKDLLSGLRCSQFRFGYAVEALEEWFIDVEILADHVGSDPGVAQSERQRVRQWQFAQRLLAWAQFVAHQTSVRPRWPGRASVPLLDLVGDQTNAYSHANGYPWDLVLRRGSSAARSSRLVVPVFTIAL
jgi:hypothetical protein